MVKYHTIVQEWFGKHYRYYGNPEHLGIVLPGIVLPYSTAQQLLTMCT